MPSSAPICSTCWKASSLVNSLMMVIVEEMGDAGTMCTPISVVGPRSGASVPADRFNLVEAWQRWMQRLGGQPRRPSGLVHLMAAGSVHGLRPLRYERKIARRRFVLSLSLLLLLLYGIAREVF